MSNVRFAYNNRWSAAIGTITASASATALPVGNTQNPERTAVWRSPTGAVERYIDRDLGSVLSASLLVVVNPKLIGGEAIKFYHLGDAAAPGAETLVATLPAADADSDLAFIAFASQSHRHWRVKWPNVGAANDYAEAGHIFIGDYFEPSINADTPLPFGRVPLNVGTTSVSGQKSFAIIPSMARGDLLFRSVSAAILADFKTMYRSVETHTPFVLILDNDLTWAAWYGRFTSPLEHPFQPVANQYDIHLGFEEAL